MCSLAFIATTDGTARERVMRVASQAWPKPPWPRRLSIRYCSFVSGLGTICWGRRSAFPRAARTAADIASVVARETLVVEVREVLIERTDPSLLKSHPVDTKRYSRDRERREPSRRPDESGLQPLGQSAAPDGGGRAVGGRARSRPRRELRLGPGSSPAHPLGRVRLAPVLARAIVSSRAVAE